MAHFQNLISTLNVSSSPFAEEKNGEIVFFYFLFFFTELYSIIKYWPNRRHVGAASVMHA